MLLTAALALPGTAAADLRAGVAAYRAGDYKKAFAEFSELAKTGDSRAQFNLGVMYMTGRGVARDIAASLEWHRKAAEQKLPAAQHGMGVFYYQGNGVEKDYGEALRWFRLAATQGFANSQFNIAVMYFNEQGLVRNDLEIVKWVSLAAGQDFVPALLRLAEMYEKGIIFTRNDREAMAWYARAAARGDARAAAALARLERARSGLPSASPAEGAAAEGPAVAGSPAGETGTVAEDPLPPPLPRPAAKVPPPAKPETATPAPLNSAPKDAYSNHAEPAKPEPGMGGAIAAPPKPIQEPDAPHAAAEPKEAQPVPEPAHGATPAPKPEKTPAAAAPAEKGGEWRVQFASFRNIADAVNAWQHLKDKAGPALAGIEPIVAPADLGQRGVYHRLQAGPLSDGDTARALCAKVQAAIPGQDCLAVRTGAQ